MLQLVYTMVKRSTVRIMQDGMELMGLILIELKHEIMVKPSGQGVDVHFSYVHTDKLLRTHVTHERYKDKRRHRQVRVMPPEKMVRTMLSLFSQPEDPPPEFGPLDDAQERKKLEEWFNCVLPKVIHRPTDVPVQVFRDGPVKDFLNAFFSAGPGKDIDIGPILRRMESAENVKKKDTVKIIRKSEMAADGSVVGFKDDPSRTVIAFKDDLVLDMHTPSDESHILDEGLGGIEGFMRTLRRKKLIPKNPP